ncbi:endolytic transglycosylase MltG [Candidatus Galacturonibacter soehngenii]|uniref:Endolytic transglycosylase MltG n=1 Tax=Candidatus Galacturonatibacter soehngenii TaxID=2307010 RepID=A0A7V7QJC7_9FIRM|nr:endolytic transglycosylase MltG [Candidatus Galacturonibacter soehngenii]KAB1437722.1 endolytic transglycosylase MltG [Candidatus Galacturonibacter soehngenii]MBA4686954.1 endolytic transglycosylase MltG [Candidatus Galacturonibacter soehngenii]
MSAKKFVTTIISVSVEVIFLALIIIVIYNGGMKAYSFGFSVFAEQPITAEPGRDVSVTIDSKLSAYELGKFLEEKGLVRDAKVFYVQMKLMSVNGKVKSGRYTLNTSMTAEEMIQTITADSQESEKEE